ncbi:MAG: hypothetical protein LBK58_04285 [Prevotellaceae bacterium]|jgi:hypothetical protein|nr:hypothetical protein [Prevotellaceae bacterium]
MAFDAYSYFEEICRKNKITAVRKYKFCRVTGISYMEEMILKFKSEKAYFCVDDTEDGNMIRQGGGFVERRQYTVFLLKKYDFNKMGEQHAALNECREIYRQIVKKLIRDRRLLENDMTYLRLDRIPFYEIPGYFISGCTGLYFMITIDIPVDLCYNGDEWN